MKPTPRTDALITGIYDDGLGLEYEANALADHARDLERQLSDALEREKALRQKLTIEAINGERVLTALKNCLPYLQEMSKKLVFQASDPSVALLNVRIIKACSAIDDYESGDEPTYTDCPIHGRHEGDCPRC